MEAEEVCCKALTWRSAGSHLEVCCATFEESQSATRCSANLDRTNTNDSNMVHLTKHNDYDEDKTDDEDKYETIQKTVPVRLGDSTFLMRKFVIL